MKQCLFCQIQSQVEDNFCRNCGKKLYSEFNLDNFVEVYHITLDGVLLKKNGYLNEYAKEHYPVEAKVEVFGGEGRRKLNGFLGSLFMIGCVTRTTESLFQKGLCSNFRYDISNDREILEILKSKDGTYTRISKIANLLDIRGTVFTLGNHIKDFSVFGLDKINKCLSFCLNSHCNTHSQSINSIFHGKDREYIEEMLWRNATFGYCFKLAEEMVEANK
ncbi:hypothetical protein ACFL1I_08200 [Candidatus Omnitrophota bacterium]